MSFLSKQRKLLATWCKNKSHDADKQRDFERREAARKAALTAARSLFFARSDRFSADGRH